jgi:Reverse transcriptase (RNA-dependent DNA polymerase)
MPIIDDILPQLTNCKVFSTADAKAAFWMTELDDASSKLMTFEIPLGKYRWLRMPYGTSPIPEIFQRKMHETLRGVACIADNLLVYGRGETNEEAQRDHDSNMLALLDRCRQKNIRLNKEKFRLNRESETWMGHVLNPLMA